MSLVDMFRREQLTNPCAPVPSPGINIYLLFLLLFCICSSGSGQITDNSVELRIRNDNAGEISNLFNTGDDLGETYAIQLSVNLLKIQSRYNFRVHIESTEFSALNEITPLPDDLIFTELNNFQIAIDNNKFKEKTFFFSGAAGLYYILGRLSLLGAAAQKNMVHNLMRSIWPDTYWIYVDSPVKDRYIPYAELEYGYNKFLFVNSHNSLIMINNLEGRLAGDFNFSGIGVKTYFDLKLKNDRFWLHTIDIEFEGYYMTNFLQYHTAYIQIGPRFNFRHVALYFQLNKPLVKHLDNPYIKFDDLELQFHYGFAFIF